MAASAGPRSAGEWLVDLGRDYALSPQAALSDADAEITLLFMQAAARVQPDLPEAHLWQADMLAALGREGDARDALEAYIRLAPADILARLDWLDWCLGPLDTADARAAFSRSQLDRPDLPPEVSSDLRRRLAEYHMNRGEADAAEAEARSALHDEPGNLAARALLERVRGHMAAQSGTGAFDPSARRVASLLDALKINPASAATAWMLGDELRWLGMPDQADRWYRHAAAMYALIPPGDPPPALLAAHASSAVDADRIPDAEPLIRRALQLDPNAIEALQVDARIARRQGQEDVARERIARAADAWRALLRAPHGSGGSGERRPPTSVGGSDAGTLRPEGIRERPATSVGGSDAGTLSPEVLGEMAWFFAEDGAKPDEAERLARLALAGMPESTTARAALGSALRQSGRLDDAEETLAPAADLNVRAAIELARTFHATGRHDQAGDRLRAASTQPAEGSQRESIAKLMAEWQVDAPIHGQDARATASQPALGDVEALLEGFPADVLAYPGEPGRFLSVELTLEGDRLLPGEPWRCTFRLTNTGPFPITLGAGRMVVPEFLCSITTRGDRTRSSGWTLHVSIRRGNRLMPGESVEARQTLDVGTIRSSMIGTPQQTHDVTVEAILSPLALLDEEGREVWVPAPGGLRVEPLRFRRVGLVATSENVQRLIDSSRGGDVDARIMATQLLAMLLAEHQHLAARRLRHAAQRIDAGAVQAALLERTADPDWHVCARLAECMRWFALDRDAGEAAAQLLQHPHGLVRGLTLRLLADQYRHKVANVLERYARDDPDEWVRRFAASLLAKLNASSQPADEATAAEPGAASDTPR